MSKASQIIVLCEDRLQEVVVRCFLKRGWKKGPRYVRVVPYPHGGSGGSGEKHVRDSYPNQLRAYRSRLAKTILIVVIDADAGSVQAHHQELDDACRGAQPVVAPRQDGEAIVHVIPKWHLETWLAYLDGVNVSEGERYKPMYAFKRRESDCHSLVDKLATACKNGEELSGLPNSLLLACNEFDRIRNML